MRKIIETKGIRGAAAIRRMLDLNELSLDPCRAVSEIAEAPVDMTRETT